MKRKGTNSFDLCINGNPYAIHIDCMKSRGSEIKRWLKTESIEKVNYIKCTLLVLSSASVHIHTSSYSFNYFVQRLDKTHRSLFDIDLTSLKGLTRRVNYMLAVKIIKCCNTFFFNF